MFLTIRPNNSKRKNKNNTNEIEQYLKITRDFLVQRLEQIRTVLLGVRLSYLSMRCDAEKWPKIETMVFSSVPKPKTANNNAINRHKIRGVFCYKKSKRAMKP